MFAFLFLVYTVFCVTEKMAPCQICNVYTGNAHCYYCQKWLCGPCSYTIDVSPSFNYQKMQRECKKCNKQREQNAILFQAHCMSLSGYGILLFSFLLIIFKQESFYLFYSLFFIWIGLLVHFLYLLCHGPSNLGPSNLVPSNPSSLLSSKMIGESESINTISK